MSEAYVNQDSVLVVKVGHGEYTYYLLDVEARKRAYDLASGIQVQFPDLAHDILTILVNSRPAVEETANVQAAI